MNVNTFNQIKKCFSNGFTLVEFMTVLAVAAIFTTIAVPGYRNMIQNNKATSATNKLSASIQLARMEAIKRGVSVVVCPTANTNFTACGSSSQWSNGWIVFVDGDDDNTIDALSERVKISQGFSSDANVTSASDAISYDSSGFLNSGAVSLSISTPGCTGNNARTLNVSASGRVSVAQAACS